MFNASFFSCGARVTSTESLDRCSGANNMMQLMGRRIGRIELVREIRPSSQSADCLSLMILLSLIDSTGRL